jgi:hypothetical protein
VLTGQIVGIRNNDDITATYSTTATINSPVGTYPIVPALVDPSGKLPNYAVTANNGTLTVLPVTRPVILSIVPSGGTNLVITWTAQSNSVYRVQYKTSLSNTNWNDLAPDVTATGSTASYTDHPGGAPRRFYRILLLGNAPPPQPVIKMLAGAGSTNVVLAWSAISNGVYRVQYKTNLSSTSWNDLAPDVTATGSTASFTDHPVGARQRYYRVGLLP